MYNIIIYMSNRKQREHFGGSAIAAIPGVVLFFVFWIAMYFLFKRGPSVPSFFAACCCSPFFVIYAITNPI